MYRESEFTKEWYKPGEVGKLLGISPRTVQDYDRRGQLVFERTETGRRLVPRDRLLTYLDSRNMLMRDSVSDRRDVIYARVNCMVSDTGVGLNEQVVFLLDTCGSDLVNPIVMREVGSSLDASRPEVQRLIRMVMKDEVRNVYVTYRDRLATVGFEYLETAFLAHGTQIVALLVREDE